MSIAEIINERGQLTRIDFWNDKQTRVIKSHSISMEYIIKRKEIASHIIKTSGLLQNPLYKELDIRVRNYFLAEYGVDIYEKRK